MDRPNYPAQSPSLVLWSKSRVQAKRYLALLWKLWWVLPLTVSLGICLAAWFAAQLPPNFLAVGRMMVSAHIETKEGASYIEEQANFFGTQVELMQSVEVQKRARARVQALHPELQPEIVSLKVEQIPHASIFVLRVEAESAPYAQAYLDAVMDEYIDTKRKLRTQTSDSTTVAIADELTRLEKDNIANDDAMHEFQKAHDIGFLQADVNDAATYLAQKNRELADLKIEANLLDLLDLDQNLDRERSADTAGGSSSSEGGAKPDDKTFDAGPIADYLKAKQDLDLLNVKRAQLSRYEKPKHPDVKAIDAQIDAQTELIKTLRSQSEDEMQSRRKAIQLQIKNLNGVIDEWQKKALDLSSLISEFDRMKTKSDRDKEEYERLLTNKNSVEVTKNIDQDTISILERASPGVSVKPGLLKVISGGLGAGFFLGLLILFVVDKLDDRVNSFIEIQTSFPHGVLAQIPHEKFTGEASLLHPDDDRLALLEAFRSLRSSLIFLPVEGARPKTLVVTSALPNEGKTTIASNLAITLAFSGARTLLVDADMRRGKLSQLFGIDEEGNGLSSIMLGDLPWHEAVHETTIDNLTMISCGPPVKHPAEHLLGKVADHFLREIYKAYDYVIFDSPPVNLLDDTLSLSPKVDGTIMIVRFGISSVRASSRALELLGQRQTNILGIICNDVPLVESESNYGYYYRQSVASYTRERRSARDPKSPAETKTVKEPKAQV